MVNNMSKKILITGAGSGFGEGTAIGLAKAGHQVIAGVNDWPQATQLRKKVEELNLQDNLRIEKLDILHEYDVKNALKWDIDILVNNAAIGENGPIAEIPLSLVRRTFDTNVFATLELSQKFVKKFVDAKKNATVVFVTSMGGLVSPPGYGCYCATKHALECIAETMRVELAPYNIKIKTINPGKFNTGFNQTMAETTYHWQDDSIHFTKEADIRKNYDELLTEQYDPQIMIDAMVKIIPDENSKFRNVIPDDVAEMIKTSQNDAWNVMS